MRVLASLKYLAILCCVIIIIIIICNLPMQVEKKNNEIISRESALRG